MAADWLIKKENPICASTFHIPRLIWYAWFNTKFQNLTWGSEYCQASESKSLNPSVSVRSWACCWLPEQRRLHCRVRLMLKLNEDVRSHFRLLLNSSAPDHFVPVSAFPSPLRLCPIVFLPHARLTFIRQYPFSTGTKEHTEQLKCQGTSVYLCGYTLLLYIQNFTHQLNTVSLLGLKCTWWVIILCFCIFFFLVTRKEPFDWISPGMNEINAVRDYHAVSGTSHGMRTQTLQWRLRPFIAATCDAILLHSFDIWFSLSLLTQSPSLGKVRRAPLRSVTSGVSSLTGSVSS